MGFNCGIVGLPNVGKSTIFNALTKNRVSAENYPFCTINPNVGIVPVPDQRLKHIHDISPADKMTQTTLEIVDVAGLVKGASKGEGLGNQFLSRIAETDAILEVVRVFEDENIAHVTGSIDPMRDVEIIRTELMLKDIEILDGIKDKLTRKARAQDKKAVMELQIVDSFLRALDEGKAIREIQLSDAEKAFLINTKLLTAKPILYVANVAENELNGNESDALKKLKDIAAKDNTSVLLTSGKIEEELSELEDTEKKDYLESLGLLEAGLDRLVREGHRLLDLITFFTLSKKENRAWTVNNGAKAPQAAGKIHTDFERGFIRAEVMQFQDFFDAKGEVGVREKGKLRIEGKEYIVKDGDIIYFRFNV